jgi:HEAT repeat protein
MLLPGRGVLFYGAVVYGLFRFFRGVVRSARLDQPFPWGRVIALGAIPLVSVPVLFFAMATFMFQRNIAANQQLREADAEYSRELRRQAGYAYEARQNRTEQNVDTLVENLNNSSLSSRGKQCEYAAALGRSQSDFAVEPILQYLRGTQLLLPQVQVCLVKALADLGELEHALGYYRSWMADDRQFLYFAAIRGLGEMGPDAASEAIPLLQYVVDSGSDNARFAAAQALGDLGPDAEELLNALAEDRVESVRAQARQSLRDIK